ncbi:MAG: hypothetical protein CL799_10580 [Chromatiales bacterium]|nr:hypothetical protein [Chromatiales bacterium]
MDDADQFARQRLNSFDHEMLGRKMTGDFSHRSPPRRAYSDHFEYMPREAFPRRTVLSDFDQPLPRRPMMDGFDEPRAMRGGNGMDFRRVSPGSARRAMFGEDDLDRLSEDLDGLRLDRGFGGAGRRAFVGPDRLERGFRDRFRGREYYGDDDLKHTRFADGTPGLNYGRPTGRAFVNDGYRTLGRGRAASYWGE